MTFCRGIFELSEILKGELVPSVVLWCPFLVVIERMGAVYRLVDRGEGAYTNSKKRDLAE